MGKGRLEAFSDGVIAIIITIMVLEMKVPHGVTLESLLPLAPVFLSYVLSFINIGLYWNNHHHLMQVVTTVNGRVLWANMHLLFWLSLVPFVTGWMGENHFSTVPVAVYGFVICMAGVAYFLLVQSLLSIHDKTSTLAIAVGKDTKGVLSVVFYVVGIALCFVNNWLGVAIYAVVAGIWLIPDRRIEKRLPQKN